MAAARALGETRPDVVTMNCGFGVLFQKEMSAATEAVVVSSSLILLPLLAAIHGDRGGVLTYDRPGLSQDGRRAGRDQEVSSAA